MTRKLRTSPWLLAAAAVLALVSRDAPADCASSATTTATQLYATSYMDGALNGSSKEDTLFFSNATLPNVFFLLDNSGSMKRLAPNGPAYYPGTLPTLRDPSCGNGGDLADPSCGNQGLRDPFLKDYGSGGNQTTAVVGCGGDTRSATSAASSSTRKLPVINENGSTFAGTIFDYLNSRTYSPACGAARDGSSALGLPYNSAYDYALESNVCPHYASVNGSGVVITATGDSGFDSDFYCGSGSVTTVSGKPNKITSPVQTCASSTTACGGTCNSGGSRPNFFDKNLVFHDVVSDVDAGAPADGWNATTSNPWQTVDGSDRPGSIAEFCAQYGNTTQGGTNKQDICNTCLGTRGFFLDGNMYRQNEEGRGDSPEMPYPSIWYSGNYLNFWPPKFLVQRKVMKDLLMSKPTLRTALGKFDGSGLDTGDMKSFSPACDGSNPSSLSDFLTWINTRLLYDQGTPLAQAMLDVGNLYHSPATKWFGATAGTNAMATASICYACQPNYLIVVTDGQPKFSDGNSSLPTGTVVASDIALNAGKSTTKQAGASSTGMKPSTCVAAPTGYVRGSGTANGCSGGGIDSTLCPDCWWFGSVRNPSGTDYMDYQNNPIRVSYYLSHLDLRTDSETSADCAGMAGNQFLTTFTLGFGTAQLPGASTLLQKTASVSGGQFFPAESPKALRDSLTQVVERISGTASTFGVSSISTLQTVSGSSVIVPRFEPGQTTVSPIPGGHMWKGHLYRFEMKSEFVAGCTPGGTGDVDCDGKCSSVFLVDGDGAYIVQDANGAYKKSGNGLPLCNDQTSTSGCSTCGGFAGPVDANPFWEAGRHIAGDPASSTQIWLSRHVYTVLPSSADKFDGSASTTRLTTGIASSLIPYLQLKDATCASIASQIDTAGDHKTAALLAASSDTTKVRCAQELIRYVLGADVFNERKSPYYPRSLTTDATAPDRDATLPDRLFMLGDIFHSSPVVVDPPLPDDGILCPAGLHNQCISSLWKTPVPSVSTGPNAYHDYAYSSAYQFRNKVVLVGANDGMLHAFLDAKWVTDASYLPLGGYYDKLDQNGTRKDDVLSNTGSRGNELWAFLPPDMLPKVPDMLFQHQFYVDGTPMVRDVWVDGTTNTTALCSGSADGKKQACEFHTVAVIPERRGGTRYFALDVTNATSVIPADDSSATNKPTFLWMYPQITDSESLSFGETYSEFLPTAPPIGPVRLADASATAPKMTASDGTQKGYQEKWIAFLSGGYDMEYVRGRGVHMVDVWDGTEIWDFTGPKAGETVAATDPRFGMLFPVAAPVGMVMWGQSYRRTQAFANDGYFDTATFGDTGGQLWVLRFSDPGTKPSSGLVSNWYGARTFQMGGTTGLCSSEPFFYITANVAVSSDFTYRVLAGTGDRYNLLDTNGGVCGPDNIRACLQQGCTVSATTSPAAVIGDVGATGVGDLSWTLSATACGSSPTYSITASSAAAPTCSATGRARIAITNCPTTQLVSPSTTKDASVMCIKNTGDASLNCTPTTTAGSDINLRSGQTTNITQKNSFFSVKVFESTGNRNLFATPAAAQLYDGARLSESSSGMKVLDGTSDTPAVSSLATALDKGWRMQLQHSGTVTLNSTNYSLSALDERVSSTSAIVDDCIMWNTMLAPYSTVTSGSSCTTQSWGTPVCNAQNKRMNYFYGADAVTGGICLKAGDGSYVRSVRHDRLVPPPAPQFAVFVNSRGQTQTGMPTVNSDNGAENQWSGKVSDAAATFGTVPLTRSAHACRHAASAADATTACQ